MTLYIVPYTLYPTLHLLVFTVTSWDICSGPQLLPQLRTHIVIPDIWTIQFTVICTLLDPFPTPHGPVFYSCVIDSTFYLCCYSYTFTGLH